MIIYHDNTTSTGNSDEFPLKTMDESRKMTLVLFGDVQSDTVATLHFKAVNGDDTSWITTAIVCNNATRYVTFDLPASLTRVNLAGTLGTGVTVLVKP